MSLADALKSLPHGKAFRFVDQVTELEPGKRGCGTYTIRGDEDFLKGHFPGRPMMPGVILVEALAQLGGVVAQSDTEHPTLSDVRLTAMRNVKVLGTAEPGECLTLSTQVAGRLGNLIQLEGDVTCNDRLLVKAQLTLSGQLPDES